MERNAVADPGFSSGGGGAPTPKMGLFFQLFAENCMKMKEFGPPGGGASLAPPLDPPMKWKHHFIELSFCLGHCNELSPCHHICMNLPQGGYECICKDGYTLHQNGFSCESK